jgi:Kyakuja-Dileera-Zisupton transposase
LVKEPTKFALGFRGKFTGFHSSACVDGCFEQARLRHAGSGDQSVPKAHTFFLTASEVLEARQQVEEARKRPKKSPAPVADENSTAPGLFMPNYIYNNCSDRFLAAGELNKKSEASVFEDTGLMALVCRHDRPLFVVTLQDPGERQYNAVALVNRLFKELPSTWRVGLLYDIGCQMHHSIVKVPFLPLPAVFMGKLTAFSIICFQSTQAELPGRCLFFTPLDMNFLAR